jgi:hypothetical protein
MKAQRRHDLKQNTLARGLETLPEVSRRHGTKILVVVMVGLLVTLLIRNRVTSARADAEQAAYWLTNGRDLVRQLRDMPERVAATQFVSVADQVAKNVDQAVQQVLDLSDDARLVAEARLVQGDLNWELASLPEPPGATTRPQIAMQQSDEQLLQKAADAYQAVLSSPKAPKESEISARLGLAAVAENRRQWDQAKDQYQKIVDDPAAPKPLKDLAGGSLSRLEIIRRAPLIGQPASQPALSTQSATTSTAPATTSTAPAATSTAPTGEAKPQAAEVEKPESPRNPG